MEIENEILEINSPDDFHHHIRDGDVLRDVLTHASYNYGRILVMPNTIPPVRNLNDVKEYHSRIINNLPEGSTLDLLLTLYLTDETTVQDIIDAKESGLVYAVKLYPANVTTNSHHGVTSIDRIKPVLSVMSTLGMPLLIHGEVNHSSVDIFDREKIFLETVLTPMRFEFPDLKIVLEHITTSDAVEFVEKHSNIAATITIHHLLYNRSDIFSGNKIHPHLFCLPILKHETDRQALLSALLSGSPKYFFGTDSAPHAVHLKECSDGCAGVFSSPVAIPLLIELLDQYSSRHLLNNFVSVYGAEFYGIPKTNKTIKLKKEEWEVPLEYQFGNYKVRPLKAGEKLKWKVIE